MVKEWDGEIVTDTEVEFREHSPNAQAKRVSDTGVSGMIADPDGTRTLKPTTATVGAGGTSGFDLLPNRTYRFVANAEMHILLATTTGITPDADDILVPANTQVVFRTGKRWRRLEVFSTPGGKAQVVETR